MANLLQLPLTTDPTKSTVDQAHVPPDALPLTFLSQVLPPPMQTIIQPYTANCQWRVWTTANAGIGSAR